MSSPVDSRIISYCVFTISVMTFPRSASDSGASTNTDQKGWSVFPRNDPCHRFSTPLFFTASMEYCQNSFSDAMSFTERGGGVVWRTSFQ